MIHWDLFARFGWRMVDGFGITLQLTGISVALGFILAVPFALVRAFGSSAASGATFGYTYLFRGTPILAQLFLVYYGSAQFRTELEAVGLWWLFRDAYFCALLTFTLNTAAYQTEIFTGAMRAVPRGQIEAGQAAGMPFMMIARRIIILQAARYGLRPLGNEIILMLKASALASIVTVYDLLAVARLAFQRTYDFQAYIAAALVYVATVEVLRRVLNVIDRRLNQHMPRLP